MSSTLQRTYLDLRDPTQLIPAGSSAIPLGLRLCAQDDPLIAQTHIRVGEPWDWSVLRWGPEKWDAYTGAQERRFYLVVASPDTPEEDVAGIVWLHVASGGDCEILAFGLVPQWVGRGIGGHALTLGLRQAWSEVAADGAPVRRVWLHTSTADHPHALHNYKARGLVPYFSKEQAQSEES